MRDKYIITLAVVAAIIVVPAGVARLVGASSLVLARLAVIQLLVLLPFFVTSLASLALGIRALIEKKWKRAGVLAFAMAIPSRLGTLSHHKCTRLGGVDGYMKTEPNQSPEPTTIAVTFCADAQPRQL